MNHSTNPYRSYLESWSAELRSRADRVRDLIGSAHWLSVGSHKESIVREFFSRYVPGEVTVGHGFVRTSDGQCSHEIDVLVGGGAKHPPYFNEGGLQILPPEDVLAAMEIKTRFGATELREALERHARNHTIFLQSRVDVIPWQGAFFFECRSPFDANRVLDTVEKEVRVILSSYGPKIDQSSVRRNSLHFPLPTFLVLFETCLIMFRTCDDPSIVHIDLFESESLSFGLAAIDFFSYAASRLSGSTLPTSLELSREYVERYHWHRRTLSIETEK